MVILANNHNLLKVNVLCESIILICIPTFIDSALKQGYEI